MARPRPSKNQAVIMVHGGVGDFLFQLDLAKRLGMTGINTLILARKNHAFFREIIAESNVSGIELARADGLRYLTATLRVFVRALIEKVVIVNSFNPTRLRLPTRVFYAIARLLSARVIICLHECKRDLPYEQILYKDREMIWERNNRIVEHLVHAPQTSGFPILSFTIEPMPLTGEYLHIHMVASALQKSYPPEKLLTALTILGPSYPILLTMTPKEEVWYMTDELRAYVANSAHITFISKRFSFVEICSYIAHAKVFCTVNTGLLWVALLLKKKVIVCDTYTDYEWNPVPYGSVTRLAHDHDEHGNSLHLALGEHEDGTFFESMYRVTGEELAEALATNFG
ncbi:MAG: hypothetical protein V4682_00105 [Patescibacteria group bacterium]